MPNWVNNVVTVSGTSDDMRAFAELIGTKPEFSNDNQSDLSFHSFVTPKDMTLEEYHGVEHPSALGNTGGKWYDWNNTHWNTKWDACNPEVEIGPSDIVLRFDTAWSAPTPVIEAMSAKFPNLNFSVWWEEEQGYGEEYSIQGNIVTGFTEWDTPQSHQDYSDRGREGDCVCGWNEDPEEWYLDCPNRVKSTYVVEVVTKYYITANGMSDALEAAKAEESGYDLPSGAEIKSVEYAEEYRNAGVQEVDVDEPEVRVVS